MSNVSAPNPINNDPAGGIAPFSVSHLAFIIPIVLLHVGILALPFIGLSSSAFVVFLIFSICQLFGITAGYHRLLAHHSYKTSRTFQFVLALFGVLAGQNGPLWWVSHHRHHHRHADQCDDSHSPNRGFFWGHMGWLFSPRCVRARLDLVADLAAMPELVLLERHSLLVNLGFVFLLYVGGELCSLAHATGAATGLQFVAWGAVASKVFVYHLVWSANSVCHRYGRRRYATRDNSRNNIIVALLTLGDGWHHNHHHCPYSARHGFRWWELDLNFAILQLLARCGLVWDLLMPAELTKDARQA